MRSSRSLLLLSLAFALESNALAQAQDAVVRSHRFEEQLESYALDLDSGVLSYLPRGPVGAGGLAGPASGEALCLNNDIDFDQSDSTYEGFGSFVGDEVVDWGVKSCGGSDLVERIRVLYTSTASSSIGGSIGLRVYAGTQGFGTLGERVFSVDLEGLPPSDTAAGMPGGGGGGVPLLLDLDLGSQSFFLPDGPVGWGFQFLDGKTGPVLVDVGPAVSTQNYLDRYRPGPAVEGNLESTLSLSTVGFPANPFQNSFFIQMFENDGAQLAEAELIPSSANLDSLRSVGGPVLGSSWELFFQSFNQTPPYTTVVVLGGELAPAAFGTALGDLLINVPATLIATSIKTQSLNHSFEIPKVPSLLGQSIFAQGATLTVTGDQLSNGIVGTFGF